MSEHLIPVIGKPCRSCGAPVVFAQHIRTNRIAAIDVVPSPAGTVLVGERIEGSVHAYNIVPARERARYAGALRTPHFATCPSAPQWRTGRPSR